MRILTNKNKPTKDEILVAGTIVLYKGQTCLVVSDNDDPYYRYYGLISMATYRTVEGLAGLIPEEEFWETYNIDAFDYMEKGLNELDCFK